MPISRHYLSVTPTRARAKPPFLFVVLSRGLNEDRFLRLFTSHFDKCNSCISTLRHTHRRRRFFDLLHFICRQTHSNGMISSPIYLCRYIRWHYIYRVIVIIVIHTVSLPFCWCYYYIITRYTCTAHYLAYSVHMCYHSSANIRLHLFEKGSKKHDFRA